MRSSGTKPTAPHNSSDSRTSLTRMFGRGTQRSRVQLLALVASSLALCTQLASGQRYRVQTYTVEHGLPSSYVTSIVQDSAGLIWFTTPAGIVRFDGKDWDRLADPSSPLANPN